MAFNEDGGSASAGNGVRPIRRASGGSGINPNLTLLLKAYGDPADAGRAADPAADAAAIMSMFAYARAVARRAGASNGECAEEALGRVFESVGRSNLAATFRPASGKLRPYVNQIIRRKVWEVLREQRHAAGTPLTAVVASRATPPDASVAAEDLAAECRRLIGGANDGRLRAGPSSESASAAGVRRHRQRRRDWDKVRHLFLDVSLRPKPRRR